MPPFIEVKNVVKTFKTVRAVNGLDLTVEKGETLALLGPNGAGKTTLVEMIEGIQTPDSGEITIGGMTWKNDEKRLRSMMGISLQETRFVEKISVRETLNLFCSFCGKSSARSDEVMELTSLTEKADAYTVHLSGGMRQRLALGIALIQNPEILLLDEPTTGLDPHARREVWKILADLKKSSVTIILTTHYMEEAEQLCDRIAVMYSGKALANGTLDELLAQEKGGEIIEFSAPRSPVPGVFKKIRGLRSFDWNADAGRARLIVDDMS